MQFDVEISSAQGASRKGYENSITFPFWNGKSIQFVAVVTTLKNVIKMGSTSQQRKLIETDQ